MPNVGSDLRLAVRTLLRRPALTPVIGLTTGVLIALALTQPLQRFLGIVSPLDPATFAGASLALASVIVMATWAPARRASRMDPVEVLRRE